MKVKALLFILLSFLAFGTLTAQKKNAKILITGTVTDASNQPVMNAIVMIDGENTSSMTDAGGSFKIKVKPTAKTIGIVSFTNGLKEEAIDGRTMINLSYAVSAPKAQAEQAGTETAPGLNTGYGVQKKSNSTTPGKTIDATSSKYATYSSVYEIIEREFSGLRVNGTQVIIQGAADFFGDVAALLVLDGVPVGDFSSISPATVETVTVLKGSSAAIYGSRGFGGAVVVTTKKRNQ
ncbi:MAG: TonB-dependent receptor plug domain-containing protein [Bacteroidota bacterium]